MLICLVIKRLNPIVNELFIRDRKLNISLNTLSLNLFNTQSYFVVPKNITLNSTQYFIITIPNKPELQQIALNNSSDIGFRDFMNLDKKCTATPYSFSAIYATLASDNPLLFKNNLLERI